MNQLLIFGSYRLDPASEQLWRGKQEVRLTGKATAVLCHLVARAGQIVTKEELFTTLWLDTVVSDAALTSCIQELRHALHDNARKPRFIETVHRRGFRFLGKVVSGQQAEANQKAKGKNQKAKVGQPSQTPSLKSPASPLVGRESELTQLHGWLAKALTGERQLVFVTGEPGIGKTTLIEAFLFGVRSPASHEENQKAKGKNQKAKIRVFSPAPSPQHLTPGVWVGGGQCIEHYGAGEAYLPILEALGRLCRESGGGRLMALLTQHAPSWLVQMPALLNEAELETLQRKTQGVTRERMLRELAEALEVVTREHPLVLVLEDLHWSDVSTLELLSLLARHREAARLLVIGTYRPVEVLTRDHPLKGIKQELQLHGQCEELALDFLTEAAVGDYLGQRFGVGAVREPPLQALARVIHQRTDGNPLFMVNVVNDLVAQGVLVQTNGKWEIRSEVKTLTVGTPVNLRQLIDQQIARVTPDERKVLEAASVAGAEFSAAGVAAGVEQSPEAVEVQCDALVRREQFLRAQGTIEWPDGTSAGRYGFVHALYQEVLYEQISASWRVRLHKQIGEREEQGYGERAREIAAELAVHFERGRDYERAVEYRYRAGENAMRRSADHEAVSHFTKGLELLQTLPNIPECTQRELTLQIALGASLLATRGFAAPEAGAAYTRALELCRQVRDPSQLLPVLWGLWGFYITRAELQTAYELAEQCLSLAQRQHDPALLVEAHLKLGNVLFFRGEVAPAREHLEQGIALYDSQKHGPGRSHRFRIAHDPGVVCLSYAAWALWFLGYPDQASERIHQALDLAQELSLPFSLAWALSVTATLHQLRREEQAAQEQAGAAITLSTEQGFPVFLAGDTIVRGWALTEQGQIEGGIAQLQQGLAAWRTTGAELVRPYYLALLAEAYGRMEQTEEGLTALSEALTLVNKTEERWHEAELYRLRGELLLQKFQVSSSEFQVQQSLKSKARGPRSAKTNFQRPNPNSSEAEAEACFLKAVEIAKKQQAKSLELRAATSLARLWQQQDKTKQAHKLLSEIYGWFTEGFDTKDLQEAKALLESLSS